MPQQAVVTMTATKIYPSKIASSICSKCGVEKDAREFYKDSRNSNGLQSWCKDCTKQQKQEKQYWRRYEPHRLDKMGYDKLKSEQSDMCACCGKEPDVFYTDHDHETGTIRGLLCRSCNLGIGYLGDNIEGVLNGLWYLLQHTQKQ